MSYEDILRELHKLDDIKNEKQILEVELNDKSFKREFAEKIRQQKEENCFGRHFAYIKFAKRKNGESIGVVGAKSSINTYSKGGTYNSDLEFYALDKSLYISPSQKSRFKLCEYMNRHRFEWDKTRIIVVLTMNTSDEVSECEARYYEALIKNKFDLFD